MLSLPTSPKVYFNFSSEIDGNVFSKKLSLETIHPKPAGKLIYVTCSILPQENENQVQSFLSSEIGSEFSLESEKHLWPAIDGFDGFYMARMVRKA